MGVRQIETATEARCDECPWYWKVLEDWSAERDPVVRMALQRRAVREAHAALDEHQAREHAEQLRELASDQLVEPVWLHPMNGSGAWPAASLRVQHWYDLDAPTAAALMVLAPIVAAAGGVVVFVARRFRVVRR